jgi:hypothetical protein
MIHLNDDKLIKNLNFMVKLLDKKITIDKRFKHKPNNPMHLMQPKISKFRMS